MGPRPPDTNGNAVRPTRSALSNKQILRRAPPRARMRQFRTAGVRFTLERQLLVSGSVSADAGDKSDRQGP
jgi:hypothetical protein